MYPLGIRKMNPLDTARELFPERRIPPQLLSKMASEIEKNLLNS